MVTESARAPAPGGLALVQAFVNSLDVESARDELAGPQELHNWLARHDMALGNDPVTHGDAQQARAVREALRALLEANNGGHLDVEAVATLNSAAADAGLRACFDDHGRAALQPTAPGVNGAIGRLLAIVYTAMADDSWERLKACRCDTCRWVFYDHSKNQRGTWCTMAVCGSRVKARAYRRRQRKATA